ncbi:uncharacterized protein EI90DRAFT_3020942 [Cantharellus anzutake]|uniref:uncharacterized protein n=1 Tax=Cantharellus anzutake TaxID=1750568 RepID=UPI00190828CB|nr:uncharacterized protein EI90DRAFT_3020942 [Cantharellus anzutake]KAF8318832.1 hypothetical protein EI90DRAFT_3020942 [Cantharellus anzutake]
MTVDERLEGVTDPHTRSAVHHARQRMDGIIQEALKNTDFDYQSVAIHNDKAKMKNGTQGNLKPLKLPPINPGQKIILDHPGGAAIEDKNGVLVAIRLPAVFQEIHLVKFNPLPQNDIVEAGHDLSHEFKFPQPKFHINTKDHIPHNLFKSGQIHYAYWHPIGQMHLRPVVSSDAKDQVEKHKRFQNRCESFYHILNMYTKQLAPNFARCSHEVWIKIRKKRD